MNNLIETLDNLTAAARRRAELDEAAITRCLSTHPERIPCKTHPEILLPISAEHTRQYGRRTDGEFSAIYEMCPQCVAIAQEETIQKCLKACGVPDILLHCSLDNWEPPSTQENQHLESAREYAVKVRRGFLILLGPPGTGKSHLAIGVMRHFRDAAGKLRDGCCFITQSELLRKLRKTYGNRDADDPIRDCQSAPILVLDDAGLSSGGRDELPMLHDILDFRYGCGRPSVLTSNLPWDELLENLGERLADRIKQSAFKVMVFSGPSRRPSLRSNYFKT